MIFAPITCFLFDKNVSLGEEFILKKGGSAKVKTTNLHLKMISNGHSFSEAGDKPMCEIEVEFKGKKEKRILNVGKSAVFENLAIKLQSVDTTARPKEKDPWSETSCGFIVTKK